MPLASDAIPHFARNPLLFTSIRKNSKRLRWGAHFYSIVGSIPGAWSANRKCALSSALFMRVQVPLALK
jgi:hypothetical protein